MKKITVCGSLKFYKEMMEITERMELDGNCMLVPIYNPSKSSKDNFTKEGALMLEKMHREKIKMADAILVVNVNNYIGSSTRAEIEYAKFLNKEIIYYTDIVNSSVNLSNHKKVVIAGSAKLQKQVNKWLKIFENQNYEILDYPRTIEESKFMELYSSIHIAFLESIEIADMLFVMNEDKNGKLGYIGYEAFAELLFELAQKLIYNKEIELVILKIPSRDVGCYEEINLWLKLGWIKLYEE